MTSGPISYDLHRLRLHGPIAHILQTQRYRVTAKGLRTAIFYTRLYNRPLRTGLAVKLIDPHVAKSIWAAEPPTTLSVKDTPAILGS